MQYLDIDNWKRKEHFHFYKDFDNPFFNICTELNIGHFREAVTSRDLSFSVCCLFAALKTANETPPMRYRLDGERVQICEQVNAGNTILNKDDTFSFCYFNYHEDFTSFYEHAQQVLDQQRQNPEGLHPQTQRQDVIHCSTLPWTSFTSFSHARNYGTGDSIPKLVFGKYTDKNGELLMPFSIEVHHALMDGIHVAQFLDRLQQLLANPNAVFR